MYTPRKSMIDVDLSFKAYYDKRNWLTCDVRMVIMMHKLDNFIYL
jgi:hypothetical protein